MSSGVPLKSMQIKNIICMPCLWRPQLSCHVFVDLEQTVYHTLDLAMSGATSSQPRHAKHPSISRLSSIKVNLPYRQLMVFLKFFLNFFEVFLSLNSSE